MIVFSFSRASQRENLREFNARVAEFCADEDNNVVAVQAQALGPSIVLTLTCAEDIPNEIEDPLPTYLPVVLDVDGTDKGLEEILQGFVDREGNKHTEEIPRVPSALIMVPRLDKPGEGWGVLLVVTGDVSDQDLPPEPGDGDDDGGDAPVPDAPVDSPAFQK